MPCVSTYPYQLVHYSTRQSRLLYLCTISPRVINLGTKRIVCLYFSRSGRFSSCSKAPRTHRTEGRIQQRVSLIVKPNTSPVTTSSNEPRKSQNLWRLISGTFTENVQLFKISTSLKTKSYTNVKPYQKKRSYKNIEPYQKKRSYTNVEPYQKMRSYSMLNLTKRSRDILKFSLPRRCRVIQNFNIPTRRRAIQNFNIPRNRRVIQKLNLPRRYRVIHNFNSHSKCTANRKIWKSQRIVLYIYCILVPHNVVGIALLISNCCPVKYSKASNSC